MTIQEKKNRQELWSTRFGFYYYNDHEIFEATDAELDAQAKQFADTGINHVMTFSVTHFRWSFRHGWPAIDQALKRIVKAFHKYEIKVTEHHSANFIFADPADPEVRQIIDMKLACRNSKLDNWPGFAEANRLDSELEPGITLKSLLQVDGITGEPILLKTYKTHYMCPNNPDYIRLYLQYLEKHIYPQGVDGIMTDDISCRCACKHCRKLYQQETGFTLPNYGSDWEAWLLNQATPEYRAWLKFRINSGNRFHRAVKEHYEQLGLRMLRPNYISTAITFTLLPYLQNFDNLPALDWAFQENNFSDIIRYSWPEWRVESEHRRMVARQRNIPSMSMFYPAHQDEVNLGWALAMSWGNKYVATIHDADINLNMMEKPLRKFEIKYLKLLNEVSSVAKLAFYDSYDNRIIYQAYNRRSAKLMSGWLQMAAHNNIPADMINCKLLSTIDKYSVVVLPEVALLSDYELQCFKNYAANGGQLILLGKCAQFDDKHQSRSEKTICELLGLTAAVAVSAPGWQTLPLGNGAIHRLSFTEALLRTETRQTIHQRWEKSSENEIRNKVNENTFITTGEKWCRQQMLKQLLEISPELQIISAPDAPEDLLMTLYQTVEKSLVLHIVNAVGTLTAAADGKIGHSDPIPFPRLNKNITIKLQHIAVKATAVVLLQPCRDELALEFENNASGFNVILPKGAILNYGMIKIS